MAFVSCVDILEVRLSEISQSNPEIELVAIYRDERLPNNRETNLQFFSS